MSDASPQTTSSSIHHRIVSLGHALAMSETPGFLAPFHSSASSSSAFSRSATASLSPSESPSDTHAAHLHHHENFIPDDNNTITNNTTTATPQPAQPEKPFHSKRPHKKSRAGCKNCKARKVKCDEARPTCRSCKLRKAECIYPDPSPATASKLSTSPDKSSSTSTDRANHKAAVRHAASQLPSASFSTQSALAFHPSPQQTTLTSSIFTDPVITSFDLFDDLNLLPPEDPFAGQDHGDPTYDVTTPIAIVSEPIFKPIPAIDDTQLRLMWFYTSETAASFSFSPDKTLVTPSVSIMRSQLVQHAFRQPFLMDSVYALAALHLSQLDPSGNTIDITRTVYYRQRSYLGYRKAIETADPETFPALLSNSLLLCALSSQTFREPDAPDLYIIDWMVVWKGIGLIVDLISVPSLVASGLQALFYRPSLNLDDAAAAVPNHLLFMISSIPERDPDFADRDAYYGCLKHLGSLFSNLRTGGVNPIMGLRITTAFTFVPARFVELARLRRPRALIILAYYAMFFKLIPIVWWTVGIGQRSLRDICKHMGPDWHHLLRAPMMAIHVDDPTAIARLILEDPSWEPPTEVGDSSRWEKQVKELTWVDNAGRQMILQPERDRMVAREMPDGPDLVPYFDGDLCKGASLVSTADDFYV
ncbi:hypothetical protein NLU13_6771 [Sarocladium strictum]|uniref:Zn(2)-C6 fungal-type domain-containing protein n=1 Tax=Sarocladium strictum TaxID=5046 RepID=A0AA39L649_SARSR|nr:hypothetical protein NLU13_6771 [Sarocladium strictum]